METCPPGVQSSHTGGLNFEFDYLLYSSESCQLRRSYFLYNAAHVSILAKQASVVKSVKALYPKTAFYYQMYMYRYVCVSVRVCVCISLSLSLSLSLYLSI